MGRPGLFTALAAIMALGGGCSSDLLIQGPSNNRAPQPSDQAERPVFDWAAGSYDHDLVVAMITPTAGAAIHYTLDGSAPTAASATYTAPVPVAGDGLTITLQAVAVKSGLADSSITSASYLIRYASEEPPRFSPGPGSFSADQAISLSSSNPNAKIYYTLDGTIPNSNSPEYSAPILLAGDGTSVTIQAIAIQPGLTSSSVAAAAFLIDYSQVSSPQFSPPSGTYGSDQAITVSSTTPGAEIHYTLDGSTPTSASPIYTAPVTVAGDLTQVTINAIALKTGLTDSSPATSTYRIAYAPAAAPVFSPAAGTYTADQTIALTTTTPGAIIRYTTDGSPPSASSPVYAGPLSVAGNGTNQTIRAVTMKTGLADSPAVSAAYSIVYPGSIAVTLNPPSATPVTFSGTASSVQKGTTLTVATTFAAAAYAWYLDYSSAPVSTGSTYSIATAGLGYGLHSVTLVVVSAGVSYSGSFSFQVVQ